MKRSAIWSIVLLFIMISAAHAGDFAVIVHKSNPISGISRQDLKKVALGKKSVWADGKTIYFITQEGVGVHTSFVSEILNKSTSQYTNYWKMAIFTGTGTPPKNLKNDEEVKQAVAGTKNAIGYISSSALDAGVKRISVQ